MFHILIVSSFLLADVDMKGNVKEEVLLIEFPDIIPEPEEVLEPEPKEEINDPANSTTDDLNSRTNVASNQSYTKDITSSTDDFFDNEYLKEVEAAKQLSSDVSNSLSKEIVDIKDIEMPVETTEGMEPDSIKNVIYAGESNIVYYLDNRYHVSLPNPLYLAHGGGKVIVDIVVDQQGKVVKATPRRNNNIRDEQVFVYAKTSAMNTVFNADNNAKALQKGSIHYTFIAQ